MDAILLHNATIVTSSGETTGSIFLSEGKICEIIYSGQDDYELAVRRTAERYADVETIELAGKHLMPTYISGSRDSRIRRTLKQNQWQLLREESPA